MMGLQFDGIYKRSFRLFCRDIVSQPMGKIHEEIIDKIEGTKNHVAIQLSRGFFKTYVFSRAYPLWLIYRSEDKPVHIMVQSMNQDQARRILSLIRDELTSNPNFSKYQFKKETDKYIELYLPGTNKDNRRTHKIFSTPLGTRGPHVHHLIADDVMKDEQGRSPANMNILKQEFWNSSAPMVNALGGQIFLVGTPLAVNDLFGDVHEMIIKNNANWEEYYYPACNTEETVSNFPEVYPMEKLMTIKKNLPSWTWQQEYMLIPVGGADAMFPAELLNRAVDCDYTPLTEEEEKYREYFLGCDVAMSSASGSDYSAFVVVSKAPNHPIRLEYIWHEKGVSEGEQIQKIKDIKRMYNIRRGIIERKGLTYAMAGAVTTDSELAGIMEEWNPTNEEKSRVLGNVQILMNKNMLCIPTEVAHSKDLIQELTTFGIINLDGNQRYKSLAGHDDLVIGVALSISAAGGWVFDKKIRSTMLIV